MNPTHFGNRLTFPLPPPAHRPLYLLVKYLSLKISTFVTIYKIDSTKLDIHGPQIMNPDDFFDSHIHVLLDGLPSHVAQPSMLTVKYSVCQFRL